MFISIIYLLLLTNVSILETNLEIKENKKENLVLVEYLPKGSSHTKTIYLDQETILPIWGNDIDFGEAYNISMDVVPAGTYQGRIIIARLQRMYGSAPDTIQLYYSTNSGSSWNQWWKICTQSDWQFWTRFSIACSRTKVAVFYQIFSNSIETDFVCCDIFDFSSGQINLIVDSIITTGIPQMNPDCCSDAEDFSSNIYYYVVYSKNPALVFKSFDEGGGVHTSTTLSALGYEPDIDWDFDNLFVTYWRDYYIYARFSPNYGSTWNGPYMLSNNMPSGSEDSPRIAGSRFCAIVVWQNNKFGPIYRYTTDFGNNWQLPGGGYAPCDSGDIYPAVTEVQSDSHYAFYYSNEGIQAYCAWMNIADAYWHDHTAIGDEQADFWSYGYDIRYLWNSGSANIGVVWIDNRLGWYHAWFDHGAVGIVEDAYSNNQKHVWFAATPNPVTHNLKISYVLGHQESVIIDIFDVFGRKIKTLANNLEYAGLHQIFWKLKDDTGITIQSGVYFITFKTTTNTQTEKIIIQH